MTMRIPVDEQRPAPAVDFAAYGVEFSWRGHRWLDFFEHSDDGPMWALWLGHGTPEGDGGIRVGTLPRARYDEMFSPRSDDHLEPVAFSGAFSLVNHTLPNLKVPRPEGLLPALVRHAEQAAHRHAGWPRYRWEVDGRPVDAAVWGFAGGWTGFVGDLDEAYLVAVGIGVPAEGLRLTTIADGAAYGMDLGAPPSLAELNVRRQEHPETVLPTPNPDAFHPDQLALGTEA